MPNIFDDMTPEQIVAYCEALPIDHEDLEQGCCQTCGAPATHSAAYVYPYEDGEGGYFCRDFGCDTHKVVSRIEVKKRVGWPPSVMDKKIAEFEAAVKKSDKT